ncbi:hypothetical protein VSS74_09140 [Conexibacter stalactiti]|uniref:Uncharacterized protein n=1 Tax=Conexibacter stalactiti TaxID=1940611 RepID=A0ABU4HR02_9ACTN|nr:hypothetical protein [Conexibacter stalactiti]MDW5594499.1 hypothetical protein [Conexibacter stalactiti]MEC5035141.1 hypothetical protein [Conexibacter stalactiti]
MAGAADGSAAATAPRLSLLTPDNNVDVRVEHSTLVVRLRANGPGFRARLDGRNVTGRFGRAVGGVRTARLVRGRDFRIGRGSFTAAVGRAGTRGLRTAGFTFVAWRRDARPPVLTPRPVVRDGRDERSALTLDVRAHRRVLGYRLWVNGRLVRDQLDSPLNGAGERGGRFQLGAHHGLRFGANRVTVALDEAGHRFQRVTRTVRVGRGAPLVSAGRDRRSAPGHAVVLDGSRSRGARRGTRLVYRWQLVERPRGARARLVGDTGRRPRLIARTPGRYRVRLHVVEARPARDRGAPRQTGARAGAAQSEQPSTPLTPVRPQRPSTPLTPLPATLEPLPATLEPVSPVTIDDVAVGVGPTDDPMGVPIQTIGGDGAIKVGDRSLPTAPGKWLHVVALDESYTTTLGDASFAPNELKQAQRFVNGYSNGALIVMTVATAQNLVHPTPWQPNRKANFDWKTFHALIASVGGLTDSPDGWTSLSNSHWSLIGKPGMNPGQAHQSIGVTQAGLPGFQGGSSGRGGTLNGYLQTVNNVTYSYVSPELLPIDTAAPGSDLYTRNVIAIGEQSYQSAQIRDGDTAAQLLVLDASGGLRPLVQATFTIIQAGGTALDGAAGNPAGGTYGSGVKGLAATLEYANRTLARQSVVVLQTFGRGQYWGNTPNGSPSWVNDDVGAPNLGAWKGGQFVSNDGTDNPNNALYKVWNAAGPTVAGQVGVLSSPVGHDVVSGFGDGQDNQGVANGGLTVVGSTHPFDGRASRVQGQTGNVQSNARMVGTLARTRQGQWTVRTAVSDPAFEPSALWELAFQPRTAWPYSNSPAYQAANRWISNQLFNGAGSPDVRDHYRDTSPTWSTVAATTRGLGYPGGDVPFSARQFTDLRDQLATEMDYVSNIRGLVDSWDVIYDEEALAGFVDLRRIASNVAENSRVNAEKRDKKQAELDWLDVSDYSLEVASGLLGFTPLAEAAEPLSLVAGVLGLASATTPESEQSGGETNGASQAIHDRADMLGTDLITRYTSLRDTITHIEQLLVSDWGKLQTAGRNSIGAWALNPRVSTTLRQSLALSATREFYASLLPLTYTQWVIDPNATGATDDPRFGPSARTLPGRTYRCWGENNDPTNPPRTHPFAKNPAGSLHYSVVHGWNAPGNTTPPAAANQSYFMLRVLKSSDDPMDVRTDSWRSGLPTIWDGGSNPTSALVDPLFAPVNRSDTSGMPTQLGIDKTEFFGDWNNGWGQRKAVCG